MLETITDFARTLNTGNNVDCIYLDYSKAFDTISHGNLLLKMRCYGLPLLTVNWVMDFLKSRKQRVMIDGQFSDWSMCTSGVPQGSVLGPLLYTLYVNDLPDVVKYAVVKMYADDTKLYYPFNNINDFYLLQSDLNAIAKWSEIWQLKLNI